MRRWLSFTLPLLAASACGPSPVSVPKGEWGGRNMSLFVDDAGASASFKCGAQGRINQPLVLNESGTFDLTGTYDPVVVNGGARSARYTGTLSGTMLQVTVSLDGGTLGTFEVDEGQPGSFDVCNY
ncbi:MAG: hypothetical protein DMF82_10650 [Acidobacteria bacterium]|nr:MAG: hypothetical protein DMF82_10650 [Acidobacteriota bacterium]